MMLVKSLAVLCIIHVTGIYAYFAAINDYIGLLFVAFCAGVMIEVLEAVFIKLIRIGK